MSPFFVDYLERLTMLHNEMDKALTGLPPAALDWSLAQRSTLALGGETT